MKRILPLLAVPAMLIAGCSTGANSPTPSTPTTTSAAPAPSGTTAPTNPPATGSGGSSGGGTTSGGQGSGGQGSGGQSSGMPRCHTSDLSLKMGAEDGAAGTYHANLIFTNKSGHKCTLYGYPGVSWVTGDNGTQVNDPYERSAGTKKTITLSPGGQAHAVLETHQALNYPTEMCKPVSVRGYRIYPPGETRSIFVSAPQTQCSVKGFNLGNVQPIASGPGRAGE